MEKIFCIILFLPVLFIAIGVYKYFTYPMKEVHYVNEWGNPRVKRIPDTSYRYKPEELWERPKYWKTWKKTGTYINNKKTTD